MRVVRVGDEVHGSDLVICVEDGGTLNWNRE